ncbi:hypothetical protein llap_15987 [Limosa lapponica baueri]|uniref:Uncharacterized protein n=1 Tax=Limosa lapponica baueri TaxID=1758121 RepID=A0A2I0TIT3_LIMLA|nr:hypothetical protein llap_15987 [Limosa lapponica baueri]
MLQLDLRARERAETQKEGKSRAGCKESDGTAKMTGKENDLGSSTLAVCKQVFTGANKIECQNEGQVANGNTKTMSKVEEKSREFQALELGDPDSLGSRLLKELACEIIDLVCCPSHLSLSAAS